MTYKKRSFCIHVYMWVHVSIWVNYNGGIVTLPTVYTLQINIVKVNLPCTVIVILSFTY